MKLDDHGTIKSHPSYPRDTHSYKVVAELDHGYLVELATGRSGRQKYWWPAIIQWVKYPHGQEGWAIVGQVNAGQPAYAYNGVPSIWNTVRMVHWSDNQRHTFKGHARTVEEGVRIMQAIHKEYNA